MTTQELLRQWRDEKKWTVDYSAFSDWWFIESNGAVRFQDEDQARFWAKKHNATLARQRLLAELLEGAMHELWNAANGEKVDHRVLRTIEKRLTEAAKGEK